MKYLAGILAAIILTVAGVAGAAEYSATMVTESSQGVFESRVFVKDLWQRNEQAGAIILFNNETGITYSLIPANKTYIEMGDDEEEPDPANSIASSGIEVGEVFKDESGSIKRFSAEKINGYTCDKYIHTPSDPDFGTSTIWYSPDLQVAIKVISKTPMGKVTMYYKDIKEEKLNDSLFVVPKEYKKIKLPF